MYGSYWLYSLDEHISFVPSECKGYTRQELKGRMASPSGLSQWPLPVHSRITSYLISHNSNKT